MRIAWALATLLMLAPLTHGGTTEPDVTITLEITIAGVDYAGCDVVVSKNDTGGDVLDQAVVDGCIDSWDYTTDGEFGRFVTAIDDIEGAVVTFWAFYINGTFASVGIDGYAAKDGDTVGFDYDEWASGAPCFLAGICV